MKNHRHKGGQKIETELGTKRICDICGQPYESWRRKLGNLWVKWKVYTSRGESFISDINGLWNVMGGGAMGILAYKFVAENSKSSLWLLGMVWFVQKLFVLFMGYMDYNYWKFAQRENSMSGSFTPPTVESLGRLMNIEKKVSPETFNKNSCLDDYKKNG